MADKHGAHQTAEAYVVSLCEDYCKSPSTPVGYMISQKLDVSTMVCATVNGCGTPVLNLGSRVCNVIGNEAGFGGGVVSGVNIGMCKPIKDYASTVRAEGQCILRHDTIMEMNCAGCFGVGNTLGKIVYIENASAIAFHDDRTNGPVPHPVPVSTEQPNGPVPQPVPVPTPPEPLRKIGEYRTKNGHIVPIYEVASMGASGGFVGKCNDTARIFLGLRADKYTRANEEAHAEMGSRGPNGFDGNQYDENGVKLTELEAEAESDRASLELARSVHRKYHPICGKNFGQGCTFRSRERDEWVKARAAIRIYGGRLAALERAIVLVREGRLDEARHALGGYPQYQAKVPIGPSLRANNG